MSEELEHELMRLKSENVVSEETAKIYIKEFRKLHSQHEAPDSNHNKGRNSDQN